MVCFELKLNIIGIIDLNCFPVPEFIFIIIFIHHLLPPLLIIVIINYINVFISINFSTNHIIAIAGFIAIVVAIIINVEFIIVIMLIIFINDAYYNIHFPHC